MNVPSVKRKKMCVKSAQAAKVNIVLANLLGLPLLFEFQFLSPYRFIAIGKTKGEISPGLVQVKRNSHPFQSPLTCSTSGL